MRLCLPPHPMPVSPSPWLGISHTGRSANRARYQKHVDEALGVLEQGERAVYRRSGLGRRARMHSAIVAGNVFAIEIAGIQSIPQSIRGSDALWCTRYPSFLCEMLILSAGPILIRAVVVTAGPYSHAIYGCLPRVPFMRCVRTPPRPECDRGYKPWYLQCGT